MLKAEEKVILYEARWSIFAFKNYGYIAVSLSLGERRSVACQMNLTNVP